MLLQTQRDSCLIRDASTIDIDAIAAIYAHHVETSCASFEEVAPGVAEMRRRFEAVRARDLPYLVADIDGVIVGFCYAGVHKERSAYRYSVEDSIYVAPGVEGLGVGTRLLSTLIQGCARKGYRQMIAVIGDSGNAPSIALHRKLGFQPIGTAEGIGFKFGRWVDIVYMQRALGDAGVAVLEAARSEPTTSHSQQLFKV